MADPADDSDEVEDEPQPPKKNWRRVLEDERDEARTALVDAQRELAFYKSGLVDLTDDQRDDVLTLAQKRGDTSAEALKAIADRLSYTKQPEPSAEPEPVVDDRLDELRRLAALAQAPDATQPPRDAKAAFNEQLSKMHPGTQAYDEYVLRNAHLLE